MTRRLLPLVFAFLISGMHAGMIKADQSAECVILLHGLGRTADAMAPMAEALEAAGFRTLNLDYPSRELPIEKLAMENIPRGIQQCTNGQNSKIHFVTHSMGGIVVRYFLKQTTIPNLGRVVMISPPNQGSEVIDALKDNDFFQWFNGPAGQQLGTSADGFVARLGPVAYPLGIITGNTHAGFDAWLADIIPGEDDGKVSVERAKVDGMTDFLVLPYPHPFIMKKQPVIEQTIHFLRYGRFRSVGEKISP